MACKIQRGNGFHADQSRGRSALSRLCRPADRACRAARRDAGGRAHDGAHRHDGDRRACAETRRRRRHDLRPRRPLRAASAQRQPDHRAAPRREGPRPVGAFHADLAARRDLLHRHLCDGRSVGRGDRRGDDAGRRRDPPLRHRAEGSAAVAFEFRLARFAERAEDARGGGNPEARRAGADQRRRDARRFGAVGDPAQPRLSAFAT